MSARKDPLLAVNDHLSQIAIMGMMLEHARGIIRGNNGFIRVNGVDVGDDRLPVLEHLIDIGNVGEIRKIVDMRRVGQQFVPVLALHGEALLFS